MENKVTYLCDGEVESCKKSHCYKKIADGCRRTYDINHAINFEKMKSGYYREKENGKTWQEECEKREKDGDRYECSKVL